MGKLAQAQIKQWVIAAHKGYIFCINRKKWSIFVGNISLNSYE